MIVVLLLIWLFLGGVASSLLVAGGLLVSSKVKLWKRILGGFSMGPSMWAVVIAAFFVGLAVRLADRYADTKKAEAVV